MSDYFKVGNSKKEIFLMSRSVAEEIIEQYKKIEILNTFAPIQHGHVLNMRESEKLRIADIRDLYIVLVEEMVNSQSPKEEIIQRIKNTLPQLTNKEIDMLVDAEMKRISSFIEKKNSNLAEYRETEIQKWKKYTENSGLKWETEIKEPSEQPNVSSFKMKITMVTDTELMMARLPEERDWILKYNIDNCFKSNGGLCPHESLILHYIEKTDLKAGFTTDQEIFSQALSEYAEPNFWIYKLCINDMKSIIAGLVERGFVRIDGFERTLKEMKADELKAILSGIGLKVSGKKNELVERIMKSDNREALERKYTSRYYSLTESGTKEKRDSEELKLAFWDGQDIWDFNKRQNKTCC